MDKKALEKEWDSILLVYADLNWYGKKVARKRMAEIQYLLLRERLNNK